MRLPLINDFFHTSHLSNPLGINLQLLLEFANGSVLLLQLLHEILKEAEDWSNGERWKERETKNVVRANVKASDCSDLIHTVALRWKKGAHS